ncbi:MAG: electron transfer flavoprotein subunit alpha/FixB family protein [Bdellovibrio sp.]|nr:MAG: electron transfer flavoprotein subunit alpha/FixB family protein [Bdellovibrio sp.]
MNTLIFLEQQNGKIKKSSLELLSVTNKVSVLLAGPQSLESAKELENYDIQSIFYSEKEELKDFNPEIYFSFLKEAINKINPDLILASATLLAKDIFPRLGAHLQTAVVSDATELKVEDSKVAVRKPLYSGKCLAKVSFKDHVKKIILMRPNQLPSPKKLEQPNNLSPQEIVFSPPSDLKTLLKEIVKGTSGKVDLSEASIIVSGGRGMQDPKNFKLLEDLAQVLGAAVGASRAVCDAGWVPHSMQVGQTGKTVAPNLYIACGISGAIQHLAGMSDSKVIVAINKDPEAPIFKKATYGIVGDALEILPLLTEEFKKILH